MATAFCFLFRIFHLGEMAISYKLTDPLALRVSMDWLDDMKPETKKTKYINKKDKKKKKATEDEINIYSIVNAAQKISEWDQRSCREPRRSPEGGRRRERGTGQRQ